MFVVDHGRTSSLVIPAADGGLLRYAYGDWNYYALGKNDIGHGIAALLWPTQGALGRAWYPGPPTSANVRQQVAFIESVLAINVATARVHSFEQQMEALYRSALGSAFYNRTSGLTFVHHPDHYTYFGNSNHAVATWLRELGCTIQGQAFRSSWRLQHSGTGDVVSNPAPGTTSRLPAWDQR